MPPTRSIPTVDSKIIKPGGYVWKQHIGSGLAAGYRARRHMEVLLALGVSEPVASRLLGVTLEIGNMQDALM
jgi:hypothetical protein